MAQACLTLLLLLAPVTSSFTEAPAFVPLFTPRGVAAGTYRTYTSTQDLDTLLAGLRQNSTPPVTPGSFEPQSAIASEAFGQSGGYNRWKLAMLYGSKRVRVARGPRVENGRVVEAWTLISPYPDEQLEHLNPGTLLIVLHLEH